MASNILIFGGTSAIATAIAARFAADGCRIYLVGRDAGKLADVQGLLLAKGAAEVTYEQADLADLESLENIVSKAFKRFNEFERVIIAHGSIGDQEDCERSWRVSISEITTNYLSPVVILTCVANHLSERKRGQIIVIGSVAGDRGRQSNYIYGASKGALERFTQGLRNRLHADNVSVLLVKPGFVDSPMTASFRKNFLFSQPETVARKIVRAAIKKRNTVYVPGFWRLIMLIIRSIPEFVFKRLSL